MYWNVNDCWSKIIEFQRIGWTQLSKFLAASWILWLLKCASYEKSQLSNVDDDFDWNLHVFQEYFQYLIKNENSGKVDKVFNIFDLQINFDNQFYNIDILSA